MKVSKDFRSKYNKLLTREKKGRLLIDNPQTTEAKRREFLKLYFEITKELSEMIDIFESVEHRKITHAEALEGFEEV